MSSTPSGGANIHVFVLNLDVTWRHGGGHIRQPLNMIYTYFFVLNLNVTWRHGGGHIRQPLNMITYVT